MNHLREEGGERNEKNRENPSDDVLALELYAAVMPLCLRASSCTIHDTNTRCYATINIIIGKTPFRFASLKNHYTSSIKHQTSIASVF